MTRKKLILVSISAILAFILATASIFGALAFLGFSITSFGSSSPKQLNADDIYNPLSETVPDKTILDTDFSLFQSGGLPEGWIKTHPYVFLEDGDKSTSLDTDTGNKSHVSVKNFAAENYLSFCGRNGEHILTSPSLESENYMVTATVNFTAFRNPFGIVTNIPEDYTSAKHATLLTISSIESEDEEGVLIPTFSISHRTTSDSDYSKNETNLTTVKISDIDSSVLEVFDSETGEEIIPRNIDITLKAIHFNDVTYFYMNDNFIGSLEDYESVKGARFGFFSNLNGREVGVKSLKVDTLKLGTDFLNETEVLSDDLSLNFKNIKDLPENFTLYSGKWLDKNNMGTAEIKDGSLKITSDEGATALMLPLQKSKDYHLSAKIKITGEGGNFGIVSNVLNPIAASEGGSFITLSSDKTLLSLYTLSGTEKLEHREYATADIPKLKIKDTINIDLYCFEGIGYYFINGTYLSYTKLQSNDSDMEFCGIYSEGNSEISVLEIKTQYLIKEETCQWAKVSDSNLSVNNDGTVSIEFSANIETDNVFSRTKLKNGIDNEKIKFGIIVAPSSETPCEIKVDDSNLLALTSAKPTKDATAYTTTATLVINKKSFSNYYTVRSFISADGKEYYSEPIVYSPALDASEIYLGLSSKQKETLDTLFKDSEGYVGKYEKTLTFTLFSDLHYKQGMYASTISDMQAILDRAKETGSSFVLSAGDFCNDFYGSPELMNCFLENSYNLPVYNVYGNHELEAGNTMFNVTPQLTNDQNVIWGTKDGKIGDGSIGYYYFDNGKFRIICTDTNYSFNPTLGEWEHNYPGSYGYPEGNIKGNSLGPEQLVWLEQVLMDAAEKGKSCIVMGHDSHSGKFRSASPDASTVRELFAKANTKRKGTVMISINGHIHTNNFALVEDVLYIDTNATRNVVWRSSSVEHYNENQTFEYIEYDDEGNAISSDNKSLNELTMGKNTWFTEDPLSAVVSISEYGSITVTGTESRWIYGVEPENTSSDEVPFISSGSWELLKK